MTQRATVRGVLFFAALSAVSGCKDAEDVTDDQDAAASARAEDAGTKRRPDAGGGAGASDAGSSAGDPGSACTRKVVINELQCNGPNGAELIELFNPGSCALDLSGWQLAYRAASGNSGLAIHRFEPGSSIAAGAFLLLANAKFVAAGTVPRFNGGGSLGNEGGQVGLLDDAGETIDGVGYGPSTAGAFTEGSPAPLPSGGASIGRKSDGADTDDNASDFTTFAVPTPGVAN
jgi:hypothetical protein